MKKDFTLYDAFNQFWQVWEDSEKRTQTIVGLYFYLVKQWNDSGRALQFRHRNTKICDELQITKPTLESSRNYLRQVGLIDFYSKGKGDPNITYEIKEVKQEVKKANDFTSHFTSHFTSDLAHKQIIYFKKGDGKEVKSFDYLRNLLKQEESLQLRWANHGYKPEDYEKGIDSFLTLKERYEYKDFLDFRNNFYFWIPNYAKETASIKKVKQEVVNTQTETNNSHRLKKIS